MFQLRENILQLAGPADWSIRSAICAPQVSPRARFRAEVILPPSEVITIPVTIERELR